MPTKPHQSGLPGLEQETKPEPALPALKWLDVTDDQIKAVGFDSATQTLGIEFKGRHGRPGSIYHYSGVDPDTYMSIACAESVYQRFYNTVRADAVKYPYKRIE